MTLTRAVASVAANVSLKTLDRAVASGELAIAYRVGNSPGFYEQDVYQWAERRKESRLHDPYTGALRMVHEIARREMSERTGEAVVRDMETAYMAAGPLKKAKENADGSLTITGISPTRASPIATTKL